MAVPVRSQPHRLGKYDILRRIAKGGMAEIFLARASGIEGFEKLVVVKRILPELAANREFVQMFLDEARIAATLHHSNIVQVYDIGEVDGAYFFSMEYLHGEDVRRIMRAAEGRDEKLPIEHALNIVIGICAGLHYAHERRGSDGQPLNIVHRDVSPHNVAVTYDGGVKVVDFGIAKAAHRLTETRHGTLKGKVQYMSPEQCEADPVDRRSDVFAIAIMLWELTTGERLYSGRSELAIMKQVTERDAPRPSVVAHGYPAELEKIVMKGLMRSANDRYQTAEELQLALEEFARERRLALSAVGLARYLRELFGAKVDAWSAASREGNAALTRFVLTGFPERDRDNDDEDTEADLGGEAVAATRPGGTRALTRSGSVVTERRWLFPTAAAVALAAALAGAGWWGVTARRARGVIGAHVIVEPAAAPPTVMAPRVTSLAPPAPQVTPLAPPPSTIDPPAIPPPEKPTAATEKPVVSPTKSSVTQKDSASDKQLHDAEKSAVKARVAKSSPSKSSEHTHASKPKKTARAHPPAKPVDLDAALPPK
jgi:serine/threonine protein kinase